jgi:hypothetical protein
MSAMVPAVRIVAAARHDLAEPTDGGRPGSDAPYNF